MHTHLLAKMDFTEEAYGWRTSLGITSLWPPGSLFLLMCGQGGLLTSRKETCGLGRAQPPPLKILLLSLSFDPWGMNLQSLYPMAGRWALGSLYLLPHLYHGGVLKIGLVAKLCPTLATPWTVARQAPLSMGFPRLENWSRFLLQGIFLTQGSNPSKA